MFYMFLIIIPTFMSIGFYLPFDPNSYFMHYFQLQKLEFKKLVDDMVINL